MERLGEYLIHRLIGEGGMGRVYEGEERLSKRRVALKVLHPELAKSEEGRRLFLNEMQILAHLEHPGIVRSLASTEVDGQLVMVLEYLDGRTLRAVLQDEGALPWSEAVRVAHGIAAALAAAHGQEPPIVHRDLKPENVMVLKDGTVKVMDFGIAKVVAALNQTNTQSVGTLQYMSPEQIDARTIDHRSDLYALGLVLYEMLAGHPPFQSASPRQLLDLQCTAEPPPLPDDVRKGLPKGVEALVFQLLEKAPEDRPYLAEDVVERLEPFQPAGAPAPRAASGSRPAGSGGHRTPSRGSGERASGSGERGADKDAGAEPTARSAGEEARPRRPSDDRATPARASGKPAEPKGGKADTIALVDRVGEGRDVPTRLAVAIIVVLSIAAGLTAYFVRARTPASETPAAGATASAAPHLPGIR